MRSHNRNYYTFFRFLGVWFVLITLAFRANAERSEQQVPLSELQVVLTYDLDDKEKIALELFQREVLRLGGIKIKVVLNDANPSSRAIYLKKMGKNDAVLKTLSRYQESECYQITSESSSAVPTLIVRSSASMGTVYALGDMQRRIRDLNGKLYLDFPEWQKDRKPIFEYPCAESRGEYINIGYNIPGITPHEWTNMEWQSYIDELILSRLNTVYFYIWIDEYTIYPASKKSHNPQSQFIHERVRDMISYAKKRGVKVIYMICPSYAPKDLWEQKKEIHAEIEYVEHGFPAVCLRAPGAMDLMKDVWRHEMQWFNEADGIQIWFYDPGGCWCTTHGCKAHQATYLASDFKTFATLFQEVNPGAEIAYNYWPAWLWEDKLNVKYRSDLNHEIKQLYAGKSMDITAVGAPDNDITLPTAERDLGFGSNIFIFASNPESFYAFLIPNLNYHQSTLQRILVEKGFRNAFGHRLEAKTRMMATYAMAEWMWNPQQTMEQVTNKWASWKTGSNSIGVQLGKAILLLEELTYNGANADLGNRAAKLVNEVFHQIPEPWKNDIGFYPAMFNAIAIISRSILQENTMSYKKEFKNALEGHTIFKGLYKDSDRIFDSYRTHLKTGWKSNSF